MNTLDPASRTRLLWLMGISAFASMAAQRGCDPMIHTLSHELGVDEAAAGWSIGIFALAYGVMQILYGPLADRFGKLRLIALASFACAAANLLTAVSWNLETMLVGRALAGATAAAVIPQCMAWIGDSVAYEERQATLARFLTGTVIGSVAGQVMGGAFADQWTWRALFWLLALMFGAAGLGLGVSGMLEKPGQGAVGRLSFRAGMVGVASVPWARRVLWVVALEGAMVLGGIAFVPAFLITRFGISPTMAGLAVGVYGIGGMFFLAAAKPLLTRLGESGLVLGGGLALGISFVILLVAPDWHIAPFACLLSGFGFYMFHNTLQTHATQMVPSMRGTAVALFASTLFLGQSAGVAVAGHFTTAGQFPWFLGLVAAGIVALAVSFATAIRRRVAQHP